MIGRDVRDMIGGVLLVALGAFAAAYAAATLEVGTLARMGPGMFPTALGVLLAGFGLLILARGFVQRPALHLQAFEVRPFVAVVVSVLAFAVTIETLGSVPAILILTLLARFAEDRTHVVGSLILGSLLAVLATLIFTVGLQLPIHPFIRPF